MKASYRWLRELTGVDAPAQEVAERLTRLGIEVEEVRPFGLGLDRVVVAEVRAARPVPDKDRLRLVTVFDGSAERDVICGAPNVPAPGGRVVLAMPGARLPGGLEIAERKVGGVVSSGMLCSEVELGIGGDASGILVLDSASLGKPGQPVAEALGLVDHVFEISLTPNRPDCLGHVGLAREVALGLGVAFRAPPSGHPTRVLSVGHEHDEPETLVLLPHEGGAPPIDTLTLVEPRSGTPARVPIRIAAPERCTRYAGLVIQHVKVGPSPFWLRYRLHVLGVRAINNVVDVTNLVLYELGHPIHAFDLARLGGPEIVVRLAADGERMHTLDGQERVLCADDLLICDGAGPVAIAGVMGGANTEIRNDTSAVLLEVAHFDARSIRRTSRRLGLHTDSSHRFERGVDPGGVAHTVRRTAALLANVSNAAPSPIANDACPRPARARQIALSVSHVERLLGLAVPETDCRTTLEALGCSISPAQEAGWRVSAPTWRPDLARPEDLIEEIARAGGYDAIPTELPRIRPSSRPISPRVTAARRLRSAAAAAGLLEAVSFAFIGKKALAASRAPSDAIILANPLSDERSVLRTSLLPGLLEAAARVRRHQVGAVVQLFEVARVFQPREGSRLPREPLRFALLLLGQRRDWVGDRGELDFYDGKGALGTTLEAAFGLSIETRDEDVSSWPFLHPRRAARVYVAGRSIGVLGELHPDVVDASELDGRPVFAELEVDDLIELVRDAGLPQAQPLPRYPAVQRDVALVVAEQVQAGAVGRLLEEAGRPLAEAVELFDIYRGAPVPAGHKSLAFRIAYRDPDATLTDARVDAAHGAAVQAARTRLGAVARD